MKRHIVTAVLAIAVALIFVSIAQAKPTPSFTPTYGSNATYLHALQVRSQALNDKFGPTNALMLRSEAMNAKYGLGDYANKVETPATPPVIRSTGMDLRDGLTGAAALLATILVVAAAIILTQRRQMRPLSV